MIESLLSYTLHKKVSLDNSDTIILKGLWKNDTYDSGDVRSNHAAHPSANTSSPDAGVPDYRREDLTAVQIYGGEGHGQATNADSRQNYPGHRILDEYNHEEHDTWHYVATHEDPQPGIASNQK